MRLQVAQLAERIGAKLVGNGSAEIACVGPIDLADENTITFIASRGYQRKLMKSRAGAVIVDKPVDGWSGPQLVVKDVNAALIDVLTIFSPVLKTAPAGIASTAQVAKSAKIGKGVSVGPGVLIDDGAEIGRNSTIAAGCKIGQNSKIGQNCRLDCNVVVYHNCTIGNNVIIQANSTIGSTGFGYALIDGAHRLIPHNGGVVIEDFVEIGANCCVDRAKFGQTKIGAGTKIDNLVQIAHNVVIGKCCLIAGQTAIAGSSRLGDHVVLAGQVGVADNVKIGSSAMVGAQSGVFHTVADGQQVLGMPALPKHEELRIIGLRQRLPKFVEQLRQLVERVEKLEAARDDKK